MITWEVTGGDWLGLRVPFLYKPLRLIHRLMYPRHPDYNGGNY